MKLYIIYFSLAIPLFKFRTTASRIEGQLIDNLLKNYNKLARPTAEVDSPPIPVKIGISLLQIINVDEKQQILTTNIQLRLGWTDSALIWNPSNYGNISTIRVPIGNLWSADILPYNIADEEIFQSNTHRQSMNVLLDNSGNLLFVPPMILKSTCKIDVTWFPFDSHNCLLIFGSWTYSGGEIDLQLIDGAVGTGSETVDMKDYLPNGEWKLTGINATRIEKYYVGYPQPFVKIMFTLGLKRESMYYFFNLIVPCALIGFLAILGFTLPPDSNEKLSLGVTVLFSLIVFLNMIAESMPSNSDAVPLLGTYFNCIMFMIASSVVSTIVVNLNLRFAGGCPPKQIGKVWQKLLFHFLPRILRIKTERWDFSRNDAGHGDGFLMKGGIVPILEIKSGNGNKVGGHDEEKMLRKQWMFVAVVVDRLCLFVSMIFILISIVVFLASSYS